MKTGRIQITEFNGKYFVDEVGKDEFGYKYHKNIAVCKTYEQALKYKGKKICPCCGKIINRTDMPCFTYAGGEK